MNAFLSSRTLKILVAAFLLFFIPTLILRLSATSAQGAEVFYLRWDGIRIDDGGSYQFPLNDTKPVTAEWTSPRPIFDVRGDLYFLPDPAGDPGNRQFLESIDGLFGVKDYAWPQHGTYEVDFYEEIVAPTKAPSNLFARLLSQPAHAQVGPFLDTIRFDVVSNTPPNPAGQPGQFKMLGIDPLAEGELFVGNSVVLKGLINDPSGVDLHFEVEVKPFSENFDGKDTLLSPLVPMGTLAEVEVNDLIPKDEQYLPGGNEKDFHWRARVRDTSGNTSVWVEFGTDGNVDFTARTVPLFTQVFSDFPTRDLEDDWQQERYSDGSVMRC